MVDTIRTVVFAAHDDGNGAFAVLCRIARALARVAWQGGCRLQMYFLNSSAASGGQARLDSAIENTGGHEAIYVPVDNLITIPKDPSGARVDASRIRPMLRDKVRPGWPYWPCWPGWITRKWSTEEGANIHWDEMPDMTSDWWRGVDLGISMGVPQLHRRAREARIPSVEVGDMVFSVVLSGCLLDAEGPGRTPPCPRLDEPDLNMIARDELLAYEVSLTHLQAPEQAYKIYLQNSGVPCGVMDGLLWTGDEPPSDLETWGPGCTVRAALEADITRLRSHTDQDSAVSPERTIVYVVGGMTGVWRDIVKKLCDRPRQDVNAAATVKLDRKRRAVVLLEGHGEGQTLSQASEAIGALPDEAAHLAVTAASDLCFTRSAGGILGAVQTRRPSVFVAEPGHWLGRMQKEQLQDAGLCVTIEAGSAEFKEFLRNPGRVMEGHARQVGSGELKRVQEATRKVRVGAETGLAKHLFDIYLR